MPNQNKHDDLKRLIQDLSDLEISMEGDMVSYYQEILPLVAYDAVQGVDVPTVYPTFYKHLITNLSLQDAFEDAKALLTAERPLIDAPQINLSFLDMAPRITWHPNGRWQAAWRFTKEYLAEAFNGSTLPSGAFAFRDAQQVADDNETTIVHRVYEVGDQQLQVWLKMATAIENDQLVFLPQVTVYNAAGQPLPDNLEIKIEWGAYQVVESLSASGLITLPAITEALVFDERDQITAALQLTLHRT